MRLMIFREVVDPKDQVPKTMCQHDLLNLRPELSQTESLSLIHSASVPLHAQTLGIRIIFGNSKFGRELPSQRKVLKIHISFCVSWKLVSRSGTSRHLAMHPGL